MNDDEEILKRLFAISDKEWLIIVHKLTIYTYYKLQGKTLFGAHSESFLGVKPIDYYVDGAIEKLFSLEWKWQYEKFSILEQLQRILGSMLSTNVEKYKANKIELSLKEDDILTALIEKCQDEDNESEDYDLFREALSECSKDDEDLQLYTMALDECNSFDEMTNILGWEKKKLYSLQQKMTRRIKSYLTNKKEIVK